MTSVSSCSCRAPWKKRVAPSMRCATIPSTKQVVSFLLISNFLFIILNIYKSDYLRHAPCIKSMATEDGRCKRQLAYLVDQVSALSISNKQTCCAHHSFRECMLSSTYRHCGRSTPMDGSGPTAVQFSRDMFSKSLAFLFKQCEDYL